MGHLWIFVNNRAFGEHTMTDPDIIDWLFLLAPSNAARNTIVADLLRHANGDRMSPEDVVACRQGLVLIAGGKVPEAAGPIHVKPEPEEIGT